jgi:hypothetical protein
MKNDRPMLASTLQSRGGKARAVALSPARRAEIAKKAAAARWKAFDAGHQAGERLAENFINAGAVPLGIGDLRTPDERATHVEHVLSAPIAKPRRALPKAGTMAAKVLEALRMSVVAVESDMIGARVESQYDHEDPLHWSLVRNTLSSLRSAGHVVSEPKPGSRKEKLWRLA